MKGIVIAVDTTYVNTFFASAAVCLVLIVNAYLSCALSILYDGEFCVVIVSYTCLPRQAIFALALTLLADVKVTSRAIMANSSADSQNN